MSNGVICPCPSAAKTDIGKSITYAAIFSLSLQRAPYAAIFSLSLQRALTAIKAFN